MKKQLAAILLVGVSASAVAQTQPMPAEQTPSGSNAQLHQNPANKPTPLPESFSVISPKEIIRLRAESEQRNRAATAPTFIPKVQGRSIAADLSLRAEPPLFTISGGSGISLTFVDQIGRPWPIEEVANFNQTDLELPGIDQDKSKIKGKSSFSVSAKAQFGFGTINVFLQGIAPPLSYRFQIDNSAKVLDGRVEIRVPGRSPLNEPETSGVIEMRPEYDVSLSTVLDGLSPQGAASLRVEGGDAVAYRLVNGQVVIRTPLQVISPKPVGHRADALGTHVYLIPFSPIVVATGRDGRPVNLTLFQ